MGFQVFIFVNGLWDRDYVSSISFNEKSFEKLKSFEHVFLLDGGEKIFDVESVRMDIEVL